MVMRCSVFHRMWCYIIKTHKTAVCDIAANTASDAQINRNLQQIPAVFGGDFARRDRPFVSYMKVSQLRFLLRWVGGSLLIAGPSRTSDSRWQTVRLRLVSPFRAGDGLQKRISPILPLWPYTAIKLLTISIFCVIINHH